MQGLPLQSNYDRFAAGLAFPIGYNIYRPNENPDWLFLAFGRFIDANLPINTDAGVRIYNMNSAGPHGWVIPGATYQAPPTAPVWAGTCDVAQSIPWGRRPCICFIEFVRAAASTGASASIEFVFTPYKGLS